MYTSRYSLRSRSTTQSPQFHSAAPSCSEPVHPGYQPPTQQPLATSNRFSTLDAGVEATVATLDGLHSMIDTATPSTVTETTLCNVLRLVIAQMKEIKYDLNNLRKSVDINHVQVDKTFRQMDTDMLDMTRQVVKTEQYNRRDMITVVGLEKPAGETEEQLAKKVAEQLSSCGETVTPADFTAVHRNGTETKIFKGKAIPPSTSVKFSKINKKDAIMRKYRNFDSTKDAPRAVKVFQSLSYHYSELRRSIAKFFNDDNASENLGKKLKWATYQSPSAGIAVKLSSDEYFKNIHVFDDFLEQFAKLACS